MINSYDTRHRTDVLSSTSASDSEGPQLPTLEVEAWFRGFQVRIMDDTVRLDSQRPSAAAAARLRRNADGGRAPVHRDRDRRRPGGSQAGSLGLVTSAVAMPTMATMFKAQVTIGLVLAERHDHRDAQSWPG